MIVAIDTGIRLGELVNLKWSDIDFRERTITIKQSKTHEHKTIPMTERVFSVLVERHRTPSITGYVFTVKGAKVVDASLQGAFKDAVRKAGITNFRFHDLRHTFASRLMQSGVDIYTVAKLLGHKNITTTQRYAHLSTKHIRLAVDVLNKISGSKSTG